MRRLLERVTPHYRACFALDELECSSALRWLFGAVLLGFAVTFYTWWGTGLVTEAAVMEGQHLCWPSLPDCANWYWLADAEDEKVVFIVLCAGLGVAAVAAWRRHFALAHALTLPAFFWKLSVMVLTVAGRHNGDLFHMVYAAVLLFGVHKLFFARWSAVVMYLLAASIKIANPGWILGTVFSAYVSGLPLIPDAAIPLATNSVLGLEGCLTWLLVSPRRRFRLTGLAAFALFHAYSWTMVGYYYPLMCLPALAAVFLGAVPAAELPRGRAAWRGYSLIAYLIGSQSVAAFIRGDVNMTLEGNSLGMSMFRANHQCISTQIAYFPNGAGATRWQSPWGIYRCDPYNTWFRLQERCQALGGQIERLAWRFAHSINGGPFYRIVDVPDVCSIEYRTFVHNEWIQLPEEGAPIVGYPVKNEYHGGAPQSAPQNVAPVPLAQALAEAPSQPPLIVPAELLQNPPAALSPTQAALEPYLGLLEGAWLTVFGVLMGRGVGRHLLSGALRRWRT